MIANFELAMHFLSSRHYAKHMRREIMHYSAVEQKMDAVYSKISEVFENNKEFLDLLKLFDDLEWYIREANISTSNLFEALKDDEILQERAVSGLNEIDKKLQKVASLKRPEGIEAIDYKTFNDAFTRVKGFIERIKNESRDLKRDSELWRDVIVLPKTVIEYKAKALAWHERDVAKKEEKEADDLLKEIRHVETIIDRYKNQRTNLTNNKNLRIKEAEVDVKRLNSSIKKFGELVNLEFSELITIQRYVITLLFHVKDKVAKTKNEIISDLKNHNINIANTPSIFKKIDDHFNHFESETQKGAKKNYYLELTISHKAN